MHFYLVALKIVLPNLCVENYQNENSISATFDFLFFLHSAQIHSIRLSF